MLSTTLLRLRLQNALACVAGGRRVGKTDLPNPSGLPRLGGLLYGVRVLCRGATG